MHCFILKHLYTLAPGVRQNNWNWRKTAKKFWWRTQGIITVFSERWTSLPDDGQRWTSLYVSKCIHFCLSMSINVQQRAALGGPTPLRPWPRYFWSMAMGLSGPTFFIASLAWKCDETNFKLILRKKVKKKSEKKGQISGTHNVGPWPRDFCSMAMGLSGVGPPQR